MRGSWAGAAAVLVLVAGCAGGSGGGQPTVSPSPSTASRSPSDFPSPGPSPSQAPVAYGAATLVSGMSACSIDTGPFTSPDPTGMAHARNGLVACAVGTNDPRVSGRLVDQWNGDGWQAKALVQWGTSRLLNAGGVWEGRFTGIYTTRTGDILTYWYTGTGDYSGLSYYMWFTEPPTSTIYPVHGMIFPGKPPTP